jgi:hypothetical protein
LQKLLGCLASAPTMGSAASCACPLLRGFASKTLQTLPVSCRESFLPRSTSRLASSMSPCSSSIIVTDIPFIVSSSKNINLEPLAKFGQSGFTHWPRPAQQRQGCGQLLHDCGPSRAASCLNSTVYCTRLPFVILVTYSH